MGLLWEMTGMSQRTQKPDVRRHDPAEAVRALSARGGVQTTCLLTALDPIASNCKRTMACSSGELGAWCMQPQKHMLSHKPSGHGP